MCEEVWWHEHCILRQDQANTRYRVLQTPVTPKALSLTYMTTELLDLLSEALTFRHREPCILGQAFRCSPENVFYIFNQQIYFIISYLLDRASLI